VKASHLKSIPKSYTIPKSVEKYLEPTENIQSNDPQIRDLAHKITKNSNDDFEKVVKLAEWVHDNLHYDLNYSNIVLDALSVLEKKRGVCAEYTTLFVALARSIGIPTKFVSGYSYGERGWERHAYAEVYLGKWIPVDPLWLEIGYLDATHIKFGEHIDNKIRNNVEVSGYDVNSIDWVEDHVEFEIASYKNVKKESNYTLFVSSDSFRKGDDGVVMLDVYPDEYIVGTVLLEPCSGDYQIVKVYDKKKKVILRPGKNETVYWKIKINDDLPKNYIFTCPLTLNSRSLSLKTINITVNTRYAQRGKGKLKAVLSSNTLELGEDEKVYINLDNITENIKLGIMTDGEKKEWNITTKNFQTMFSFRPQRTGKNKVIVYTSSGEVVELTYNVKSALAVFIENFTVPRYLKVGETKNLSACIVNNGVGEKNVRVNMNVDGNNHLASLMLKNKYYVSLPVSFNASGLKKITLEVLGLGTNLSETRIVNVYEEPRIYYEAEYNGKGILKLDVRKSKVKNVTIRIDKIEKNIDEIFGKKEIEFALKPGKYIMNITCSDVAGKHYEISEKIEFREKTIFDIIADSINLFLEKIFSLFQWE